RTFTLTTFFFDLGILISSSDWWIKVVQSRLRCWFGHFKLCAHSLNLCCLLFHGANKGCDLLLQLRNRCSLFFHCLVFFEELVQQHRVHRVVAHGVDLAVAVTHH